MTRRLTRPCRWMPAGAAFSATLWTARRCVRSRCRLSFVGAFCRSRFPRGAQAPLLPEGHAWNWRESSGRLTVSLWTLCLNCAITFGGSTQQTRHAGSSFWSVSWIPEHRICCYRTIRRLFLQNWSDGNLADRREPLRAEQANPRAQESFQICARRFLTYHCRNDSMTVQVGAWLRG